VKDVNNLTNL